MTSYQENTTKQPIECWMLTIDHAKTHRHTDKRRNGFLKHERVKHFLSNLNNNANETSASWYDVTHDDDFRRIAILKRSLNFFFVAFCGVIYQNLLHRRVYIAVSSSKLLFPQFCEKPLHITFKALYKYYIIIVVVAAAAAAAVVVIIINISFVNLWNHRLSVSETITKKSSSSGLQCRWWSVCVCLALYERLSQYKMNSEPRGRCLIINIANFDKGEIPLQPRPGADKDAGQFCTFSSSIFSARHMYSAVYAMARCLSVCHKPVFYQHSCRDQACFQYTVFPWHILHSVMRQCRYLQQ